MKTKITIAKLIMLGMLLHVPSVQAADYVIKVVTKTNNIGNVRNYISHAILGIKLYGTNSKKPKSILIYPGDHSGDAYWGSNSLGSLSATSYAIKGKGKKENHSINNVWGDRNAWWNHSTYYFSVKIKDIGDIYKIIVKARRAKNKSTKSLAISGLTIYKGKRVKSSSRAYYFPDSLLKIAYKEEYIETEGYTTTEPTKNQNKEDDKFCDVNYQDNLQGTGIREVTLKKKYVKKTSNSSSSEITNSFGVETAVEGKKGPLSAKIKAKYDLKAKRKIENILSTQNTEESTYNSTVKPKEFVILINKYSSKAETYSANIEFTIRKKDKKGKFNKKETVSSTVLWRAKNNYFRLLNSVPNSWSGKSKPTESTLNSVYFGCVNKNELIDQTPHIDDDTNH